LFSSLAGYALFAYGLSKIKAQEAGIFTYIDPVAAIVIAVPLLHETITWEFILGSILIFGGIWIAEKRIHYHPLQRIFKSSNKNN
jgi:drug/metabolite transporter (DMT)-like permease